MPHSISIDSLYFCATKSFDVTDVNLYGWERRVSTGCDMALHMSIAPTAQGIWELF